MVFTVDPSQNAQCSNDLSKNILKQTNLLKFGLITVGIIIALFCFYVIVGFLGIQFLMEPYQYGTFFAWVIILFSIFYRFTFLLLTIGVFFGIINVFYNYTYI